MAGNSGLSGPLLKRIMSNMPFGIYQLETTSNAYQATVELEKKKRLRQTLRTHLGSRFPVARITAPRLVTEARDGPWTVVLLVLTHLVRRVIETLSFM